MRTRLHAFTPSHPPESSAKFSDVFFVCYSNAPNPASALINLLHPLVTMPRIYKPGKVAVVLQGRQAGKKVSIAPAEPQEKMRVDERAGLAQKRDPSRMKASGDSDVRRSRRD